MSEEKGAKPKWKGDGIAIWENTDKNGSTYLSVKVLNNPAINVWEFKEKKE